MKPIEFLPINPTDSEQVLISCICDQTLTYQLPVREKGRWTPACEEASRQGLVSIQYKGVLAVPQAGWDRFDELKQQLADHRRYRREVKS